METNSSLTLKEQLIVEITKEVIRKHGFLALDIATMSSIRFAAKKLSERLVETKQVVPQISLTDKLSDHGIRINALLWNKIYTISDLIERTPYDLLKLRNFGKKSLIKVEDFLKQYNLKLKSR